MKARFKETARADLEEAQEFYDSQESGLGSYFLDQMEEEFRILAQTAASHRSHEDFFCFVTKRFHHLIYYRMEGGVPVIYAVLDGRRDPAYNQLKLQRS